MAADRRLAQDQSYSPFIDIPPKLRGGYQFISAHANNNPVNDSTHSDRTPDAMLKTDRAVIRCFTNTNYDDRPWDQQALGGQWHMVSVDHFGYELRRQLREAAAAGASELAMTSHDLCRSIRAGTAWLNACCKAMEQELQESDIVVQDQNGLGMSVRYKLPRAI